VLIVKCDVIGDAIVERIPFRLFTMNHREARKQIKYGNPVRVKRIPVLSHCIAITDVLTFDTCKYYHTNTTCRVIKKSTLTPSALRVNDLISHEKNKINCLTNIIGRARERFSNNNDLHTRNIRDPIIYGERRNVLT